jgi:hypothetical protein
LANRYFTQDLNTYLVKPPQHAELIAHVAPPRAPVYRSFDESGVIYLDSIRTRGLPQDA